MFATANFTSLMTRSRVLGPLWMNFGVRRMCQLFEIDNGFRKADI